MKFIGVNAWPPAKMCAASLWPAKDVKKYKGYVLVTDLLYHYGCCMSGAFPDAMIDIATGAPIDAGDITSYGGMDAVKSNAPFPYVASPCMVTPQSGISALNFQMVMTYTMAAVPGHALSGALGMPFSDAYVDFAIDDPYAHAMSDAFQS